MNSIAPAGRLTPAHQRLVQVWADPQVKGIACKYAGDPQLADDALQETYYLMARLKNLDQIENMRAYFCKVLVRQVHRDRVQLRAAALVEDFASVVDERGGALDSRPRPSVALDDAVCSKVEAERRHARLVGARDELMASVPARSDEPSRYRAVIYDAVEQILRAGIAGEQDEDDLVRALRASYPEYFKQPGASPDTRYQRIFRARQDAGKLLRAVAG